MSIRYYRASTLALAALLLAAPARADNASARKEYWAAQARYHEHPESVQAALDFARACFDLGDFATNSTERANIAEEGMAAAKKIMAEQPKAAAGHYYLGMNLGQLAQTRGIGALKLVPEMEREFKIARSLDEHIDYAGPDRNLGLLYRDAPSFFSIGNRSKAKQHLQRAVKLAPEYPENHLVLIEAYAKWSDRNGALRQLKALEEILPAAKEKFSAPKWASAWTDWNNRLQKLKSKIEEPAKGLESPRGRS